MSRNPAYFPCRERDLSPACLQGFLEAPNGEVPSGTWLFSDVRDVAAAHVLAATQPSASGRYIVSQPVALSARHVTDILKVRAAGPWGAARPASLSRAAHAMSRILKVR